MTAAAAPSDDDLRGFLLGTLDADGVETVRAWLHADPAHAARLDRLAPRDLLTATLAERPAVDSPPDAADRIARRVADTLRQTSTPADHGPTVPQFRPPPADPTPAWPPQRLGDYRVVREIGRGGMGVVLEVADDTLNRRVAAKVLNPELASKPDAVARFLREARAAAAVEHDNVVPILHVGAEGGAAYIVMPLLKGESLDVRLKRDGALPVTEVLRIGREIAAGLGAAHARGLVHRDMKPGNVWLDADTGRARVLDFGLARLGDGTDALTESGVLSGTPAYLSPEQLDGRPADARSDLFALGAILYQCATGKRAFSGETVTAVLNAVATLDPDPPTLVNPAVPPWLSDLVMRLLEKIPADRPASASAVAAALADPAANPGVDTTPWVDRAAVRSRRLKWAAGAAVAVLAAVGVWFATRPPQPDAAPETPVPRKVDPPPVPARYQGKVEVLVERVENGKARLLRPNEAGALPLKQTDKFRVEGEVDPPAYLYVVWVDPDRDVTPVYPWDAKAGWGSRPAKEEPVGKVSLPRNTGIRYTAPAAKPGVATMVLFATAAPLSEPDDVVKGWFESLPELPLPPGGGGAAVWFDDFAEVTDPLRTRTFGEVGSDDAFARWQGQLQKSLGGRVSFETAVSFARTGRK